MQWDLADAAAAHVERQRAARAAGGLRRARSATPGRAARTCFATPTSTSRRRRPAPDGRPFFAAGLPRPNPQLRHDRAEEQRRRLLVPRADRRAAPHAGAAGSRCSRRTRGRAARTRRRRRRSSRTRPTARRSPSRSSIPDYNKGPSDWDTPHNWVVNVMWDVPFARGLIGRRGALLDGWQVSGIGTMRSGQPLTVFVQNNWSRSQWSPSIAPTTGLDRPGPGAGPHAGERRARPSGSVVRSVGVRAAAAGHARQQRARRVPRAGPAHRGRRGREADRARRRGARSSCGSRSSTSSTAPTSATRR